MICPYAARYLCRDAENNQDQIYGALDNSRYALHINKSPSLDSQKVLFGNEAQVIRNNECYHAVKIVSNLCGLIYFWKTYACGAMRT